MSAVRTERLLNLFIALSSTERGMTRQQLREAIPAYASTASDAAFERSFERDKDELRGLGAQLVTVDSPGGPQETKYRVVPPEQVGSCEQFSPAEVGVALVAARLFDGTALAQPAQRAAMKLRARASAVHGPAGVAVSWTEDLSGLGPLAEAIAQRQQVSFGYPSSGGGVQTRVVDPWVLRIRHGRWYVTGWCHVRQAHRTFRLSRCVGPMEVVSEPEAYQMPQVVPDLVWESGDGAQVVRVQVPRGQAEEFCVKWGVLADGTEQQVEAGRLAAYGVRALVQDAVVAAAVKVIGAELGGQVQRLRADVAAAHQGPAPQPPADWVQQVAGSSGNAGLSEVDGGVGRGRSGPQPAKRADAGDRLRRLLALVPYTVDRPGVELSELAAQFGISRAQAVKDLELLFVCGRPGYYPDDLIDACWDDGLVFVGNAAEISSPLPLLPQESGVLRVGLGVLAEAMPEENAVVASVLAKLGGGVEAVPEPAAVPFIAGLRRAVGDEVQVVIQYRSSGASEALRRQVDPWHVVASNGFWYLQGWCHVRGAVRNFRVDRIRSVEVTGDRVSKRASQEPVLAIQATTAQDPWAVLALAGSARWVAEQPGTVLLQTGDQVGSQTAMVAVQYSDSQWLTDLVLRLGGDAEVLHPTSLREEVLARVLAKSPMEEVIHS